MCSWGTCQERSHYCNTENSNCTPRRFMYHDSFSCTNRNLKIINQHTKLMNIIVVDVHIFLHCSCWDSHITLPSMHLHAAPGMLPPWSSKIWPLYIPLGAAYICKNGQQYTASQYAWKPFPFCQFRQIGSGQLQLVDGFLIMKTRMYLQKFSK